MSLRLFIRTCSIVVLVSTVFAQERVTLPAPVTTTRTNWTIGLFNINNRIGQIVVEIDGNDGLVVRKVYDGSTTPTGRTLISNLNTANLTTRSLEARIFDRLIADGVIAGTVEGTPR